MTKAWKTDIGPAVTRLVLLALADSANDEGVCWPSMETLARKAGCGVSTARKALQALEGDGYLVREARGEGGRQRSNRYHLDVAKIEGAQIERPPKSSGTGRSNRGGGPAQIERQNPKRESPEEPPLPPEGDGSADAPPVEPEFSAGDVVTAYYDAFKAKTGSAPVRRVLSQIGSEAKKLLDEGRAPAEVVAAAEALAGTPYATLERQFMMQLAGTPGGGASWGRRGDVDEFGRGPTDATRMSQEAAKHWAAERAEHGIKEPDYTDEYYANQPTGLAF